MLIYIDILVALVGVLMYALCANPKLQEIGRLSFAFGLLAFLLAIGTKPVGFLGTRY